MKLYAPFIGIPLVLLIQHLYSETAITFGKKKNALSLLVILISLFGGACALKLKYLSIYVCVEIWLVSLGAIVVGKIINKFEPELSTEEFEQSEKWVIYSQMIWGVVFCILPQTHFFEKYASKICNNYELNCSKILYVLCGLSYIFYNRIFFYMLYKNKVIKHKNK